MANSHTSEVQRALDELRLIRGQVALGTEFRGYGPVTLAATGALALLAALVQPHLAQAAVTPRQYVLLWSLTAALSLGLIVAEAVLRSQRVHSGLAMEMVRSALEQFVPPIVAGLLLTAVLLRSAPAACWMLPGLWQILFSLGVFASCRFLPRTLFGAGIWYLSAGLACLARGPTHALSPWSMGIPFGVGQLLVALILYFGYHQGEQRA